MEEEVEQLVQLILLKVQLIQVVEEVVEQVLVQYQVVLLNKVKQEVQV